MSLKLKRRPAKILETLNLAREHQLPADPWSNTYKSALQHIPRTINFPNKLY